MTSGERLSTNDDGGNMLAARYRRLLKVYPAEHRATYEQEMVGVLMAGSRADQRFPAVADTLNLLRGGLIVRGGGVVRSEKDTGWRNAAAVTGLLLVVFLAALAARRVALGVYLMSAGDRMLAYGVDGLLMIDVVVRLVAWLVVLAAMMTGRRRTALAASAVAAGIELVAFFTWPPAGHWANETLSERLLGVVLAVAVLGVAVRGRPVRELLGRRAFTVVAAAPVLAVLAGMTNGVLPYWWSAGTVVDLGTAMELPSPGMLAAGATLLAGLWMVDARLRRRVLALVAPPLGVWLVLSICWMPLLSRQVTDTARLDQLIVMAVGTPLALAAAISLLRTRERQVRAPGAER